MEQLTLESLAQRVAALEREVRLLAQPPVKDWRKAVGIFADREQSEQIDAEGRAWRGRERQAELDRPNRGAEE